MSHPLPNMIESTLQKIRDMVDVNSVVGDPITTPEGVTILPFAKFDTGLGAAARTLPPSSRPSRSIPSAAVRAWAPRSPPLPFW